MADSRALLIDCLIGRLSHLRQFSNYYCSTLRGRERDRILPRLIAIS